MKQRMKLNQWIEDLRWCPSQIYYYFLDNEGGRWGIYLRWRHDDPWTAELCPCDENWKFIFDSPDRVNLLEEKEHTPGIITGYYTDDEFPALKEKALSIVRGMRTDFKDI